MFKKVKINKNIYKIIIIPFHNIYKKYDFRGKYNLKVINFHNEKLWNIENFKLEKIKVIIM